MSTDEISYNYYRFSLGINRKYDTQEQYMQTTYLQNYPNVDPKPHWFGNWQLGQEASVEEVWHPSCYEIQISSGLINGIFDTKFPDFQRNLKNNNLVENTLRTYGISGATLSWLDWNFSENDFLLRTIRGSFQILSGRYQEETLVDDINADLFMFNPITGSGYYLSSKYFYNIKGNIYRDVGFPLVVTKFVDALGHAIELKPTSPSPPFSEYTLTDGANRTIRILLQQELTFLDGLSPGGKVRKLLVSKIRDETKTAYNELTYNYDSNNLLTKVNFPSVSGQRYVQYQYDDPNYPGILTSIENSFGNQIKFEYIKDTLDNDDRLNPRLKIKRIIAPEGIVFDYTYDFTNSQVVVTIYQNGIVDSITKYNYIRDIQNTDRRYIVSTLINVTRGYMIDSSGNLVPRPANSPQIVLNQTQYSDDGRFNVVQTTDPIGRMIRYTSYNDFNQLEEKFDFDTHRTRYSYDIPANPSPNLPICYDLILESYENLVRTTSTQFGTSFTENVKTIKKSYNYYKYSPLNSTDPSDQDIQSTHRKKSEVDERGKTWTFDYDDAAYNNPLSPTKSTSPLGFKKQAKYNNIGKVTQYTDPELNLFVYQYNNQGQVTQYTDPNQNTVTFSYYKDGRGLHISTDQLTRPTEFKRDQEGKIEKITDPIGDSTDYEYYYNNRLQKIIRHRPAVLQDPNDNYKVMPYNNLETVFEYTPLGACNYLQNPAGLVLIFKYDEVGRLYHWYLVKNPVHSPWVTKFSYDAAGQLLQKVNRRGNSTNYSYFNSSFISKITYSTWNNGATNVPGKIINFKKYDYVGRVLSMIDSEITGSKEFVYDLSGNVLLRNDPDSFQLAFTYDDDNRLTDVLDAAGFYEISLALDNLGRPNSMTDSRVLDGPLTWDYTYRKTIGGNTKVLSLFKREIRGIGPTSNFDYDQRYQLKTLQHAWNIPTPTTIYNQNYTYRDDMLFESVGGDDPLNLNYDGLKQIIYDDAWNLFTDYDTTGNRLYRQDRSVIPNPPNNLYDVFNRLSTDRGTGESFKYDKDGNLQTITSAGAPTKFYFDNMGFLRIVKSNTYQINYLYDSEGKLVERQKTGSTGTETIHIHYLLTKPIVIEWNGNPFLLLTWDTSGKLLRVRNNNMIVTGGYPHSIFPLHDGFGNIVRLVDYSQNILAQITYDSWGNIQNLTGQNLSQFWGYRGLFSDPDTQLIKSGLRWYRPSNGRWISEDMLPTILRKGNASRFGDLSNLYCYVGNNPISKTDSGGLAADDGTDTESGIDNSLQQHSATLFGPDPEPGITISSEQLSANFGLNYPQYTIYTDDLVLGAEYVNPAQLSVYIPPSVVGPQISRDYGYRTGISVEEMQAFTAVYPGLTKDFTMLQYYWENWRAPQDKIMEFASGVAKTVNPTFPEFVPLEL